MGLERALEPLEPEAILKTNAGEPSAAEDGRGLAFEGFSPSFAAERRCGVGIALRRIYRTGTYTYVKEMPGLEVRRGRGVSSSQRQTSPSPPCRWRSQAPGDGSSAWAFPPSM
jgi:hypothetical protein